ncbi:MAG: multiheme c-type cytochrome [Planctomycetota bacterium]
MRLTASLSASLVALILVAACGGDSSGEPVAPREGVAEGTLQILTLNRLQGFAEGVPCDPTEIPPLAAATDLRDRLDAEHDEALLIALGDTLVPSRMAKAVSNVRLLRLPLRARGDAILEALAAADVDIYVPGHGDLGDQPDRLLDRCAELGIPVLISNLAESTRPDVKRFMVVTAGNLRVGVLSLLSPTLFGSADSNAIELEAVVPVSARLGDMLRAEHQVDLVVVLSNLAGKANTTLLADVRGIDIVIGSADDGSKADRILIVGDTAVMSSSPAGQEVGLTSIHIENGNLQMTDLSPRHQLPRQIAYAEQEWDRYVRTYGTSDAMQLARMIAPGDEAYFLRQVNLIDQNREALDALNLYVGSSIEHRTAELDPGADEPAVVAALAGQGEAIHRSLEHPSLPAMLVPEDILNIPSADDCQSCHLQQYRFWEATAHARAYDTLSSMKRGRDPTCLECHTTGFQDSAGWFDPRFDAPLGGVTCFSCHLATTVHSTSPRRVVDPLYVVGDRELITCAECHNESRAPGFSREDSIDLVACPPMRATEPAIVRARQGVLDAIDNRRQRGIEDERDTYLQARAMLGLGREDEGFLLLSGVAAKNTNDARLALEIAALLETGARSREALEGLRNFLFFNTGDPLVNEEYVRLLLEARDESARDPNAALAHLALIIPENPEEEGPSYLGFRMLQIDALFAAGRQDEGYQLMWGLNRTHAADPRLMARIERYSAGN